MIYDIVIIGGGIIGLATAMKIKQQNPDLSIALLEKEKALAKHQTGNNSGVIHSGLYYKPGSLKAKNCIKGYDLLVRFCESNNVPFELCGKIVVATEERELPLLKNLYERGQLNGLTGLKMLGPEALREYEPHVAGLAGFFVPQTGIVDYRVVAEKIAELIRTHGGEIKFGEKVTDIRLAAGDTTEVITESSICQTKLVINCAGLYSDKIARLT